MDYKLAITEAQNKKDALNKTRAEERATQPLLGLLSANTMKEPWEERQRMCALAADRDRAATGSGWGGFHSYTPASFTHSSSVCQVSTEAAPSAPGNWVPNHWAKPGEAAYPAYRNYDQLSYQNATTTRGAGRAAYLN